MFFDWLSCYQDFDVDLPIIAKDGFAHFNFEDGLFSDIRQSRVQHEGSFSTSIQIKVHGRRVYVSGNPSKFDRLDNLFGLDTLDKCFAVYNTVLARLGLPLFTKCNHLGFIEAQRASGGVKLTPVVDGAVITELHITTNMAVGQSCELAYLKAVSGLPYRNGVGRLHTNGCTADWLSKQGNAREIYNKIYNKASELRLHTLPTVKRRFGEESPEYRYLLALVAYCEAQGVLRFEQKLRSAFLKRHALQYWGLSNHSQLHDIHTTFIDIDKKLQVSSMNLSTLTETLLEKGICTNTKAANVTALYAINWMNGQEFDSKSGQVRTHRARLRQIGIDILKPCNLLVFSPVIIKEVIEINKTELRPPSFYRHPEQGHLRLVA